MAKLIKVLMTNSSGRVFNKSFVETLDDAFKWAKKSNGDFNLVVYEENGHKRTDYSVSMKKITKVIL